MKYTYTSLFQKFGNYLKPYSQKLFWGSFLRFVGAIIGLFNAYALAVVVVFITKYQVEDSLKPLYIIIILWSLHFIIRYILYYYSKMLAIFASECIALDVEKDALRHMTLIDISWHEKENVGNKIKRIQKGADGLSTIIRVWITNLIDAIVNFVGVFIIIAKFNYSLSILTILYLVIHFTIASTFRRKTVLVAREKNVKDEEASGFMFEVANNIRSVKVLGMTEPLLSFVQKINSELIVLIKENMFWHHSGMFFRTLWQSLGRIALLAYVIFGIFQGRYELGFFILFYGYFNTVSGSIDELSSITQDIALAKANLGRLEELFNEKILINDDSGKQNFPLNWNKISLKNLSFSYGDNKVLSNVSFDIKKGEKVGLVGLSGAGKTTIFKLLLKEYESDLDDIYIGDIPLRKIKKTEYVKYVATVLQDTEVFNLSLKKNIEITNTYSGSDDLLNKSIEVSHVNDFIHKLPSGMDTMIGEKGIKLSGGERQRLGIARAIYKNPEILFLDEATSHLDVESEQKIQDSLKHFFKDVTAVVIAHRLSTIKEMDKIIVLEHGKVLEIGTFNELYEKDGRFREFWDKQKI